MRGSLILAAGLLALGLAAPVVASPVDDRLLPAVQHTSEKGKALAAKHVRALRELAVEVYHCLPWLEVLPNSIGFFKPRHATSDMRFLSIRLYIEQEPSPKFASLTTEQRASAMFSRYVGPMLKRMTRSASILNDDMIDGFTVVLEWLKQMPRAAGQPAVHETIAVFVDRIDVGGYLSGRGGAPDLATRARIFGFEGQTALGTLKLAAWDDDFVSTFKIQGYQVAPGVSCQQ